MISCTGTTLYAMNRYIQVPSNVQSRMLCNCLLAGQIGILECTPSKTNILNSNFYHHQYVTMQSTLTFNVLNRCKFNSTVQFCTYSILCTHEYTIQILWYGRCRSAYQQCLRSRYKTKKVPSLSALKAYWVKSRTRSLKTRIKRGGNSRAGECRTIHNERTKQIVALIIAGFWA